jgi:hypothetical protein
LLRVGEYTAPRRASNIRTTTSIQYTQHPDLRRGRPAVGSPHPIGTNTPHHSPPPSGNASVNPTLQSKEWTTQYRDCPPCHDNSTAR